MRRGTTQPEMHAQRQRDVNRWIAGSSAPLLHARVMEKSHDPRRVVSIRGRAKRHPTAGSALRELAERSPACTRASLHQRSRARARCRVRPPPRTSCQPTQYEPCSPCWRFQRGPRASSRSMSSRQALKASPGCAALAAQITAMSPTASVPVRCRQRAWCPASSRSISNATASSSFLRHGGMERAICKQGGRRGQVALEYLDSLMPRPVTRIAAAGAGQGSGQSLGQSETVGEAAPRPSSCARSWRVPAELGEEPRAARGARDVDGAVARVSLAQRARASPGQAGFADARAARACAR
jgi:hypothetical protein